MSTIEAALKERIKELTCLYEVSSILVDADPKEHIKTFTAIAQSIKVGFQYPEDTEVVIEQGSIHVATGTILTDKFLSTKIKVFDAIEGFIKVYLNKESLDFLPEEQPLIDNIGIKIGDYLDRVASKQNAARLRQQMEHADRLAIIGELTAGIAHELNTPLANILGFAELLKEDLEENFSVAADLDKIIKNAIFSREVVKKLMFFSRAMPQEKTLVNIVPQVREAMNLLDATFRKENVRYTVTIADEEMLLEVDTVQLTQILFNLTINAIYFSPPDGLVQIKVNQDAETIYLEIIDEGPGLSDEGLEKVFQPFFTTKPTGSGAGLGLSVVHGIVTSHNGSISAKNNEDKGATFKVSLPK
ncbi:MAG TPA: sensor histidine kinase [Leeuwenhoekiella sp.]|uniref:sensor histidine kinase n=1 Tax=Leeuwenhoekiella palythoae TaxID=573501 RepID=UPI000E98871B|nr:HAMP domain-containing sensor histidine kinase [Leeuwenhoekiella palythoae]UBZ11666.1 HAMP domain-containing histidine kinase [Leeuwenhoekiella palythoae]HAX14360.1 sensor histidine kinase [Leeuwenhoekiella sp.]HBO29767.1 sensor histidine kinase [Leeuwenhoekiella sp.]HCQ76298.1 sensor histidine kinase [Leeuwenhoekiella sp.]